jgi:hypothetical protein
VPLLPVPIPAEFDPPVTDNEPSPFEWIVTFEADEHSIPACQIAVEEIAFFPVATILTELTEIVTGATVFIVTSWRTSVTLLFLISTMFVVEVPITVILSIEP